MNKNLKKMYELADKTLGVGVEYDEECDIYNLILEMKEVVGNCTIEINNGIKEKHIILCGDRKSVV